MRNDFPSREMVMHVRKAYPVGCRVVMDAMDDSQAPPVGTQGIVLGVDDIASVMVAWDNGGGLSVAYGADRCHKIATEEEAMKHRSDSRDGRLTPGRSWNRHWRPLTMIWKRKVCCKHEPGKRIGNGAFLCLCTQCCSVDICAYYS